MPDSGFTGISTHAPTKGATYARYSDSFTFHISTHAPTKGATANIYKKKYENLFLMYISAPAGL